MKRNILFPVITLSLIILLISCNHPKATPIAKQVKSAPTEMALTVNYADGFATPGRLFPDKLRGLPNEIVAAHFPNPCFAQYEDSMFVWKHNTTIQANEELQIVEYGSFVYTKKGWYLRVTMSPAEFAEHYNCPNALLVKGKIYTDKESWRRDKKLTGGDAMWYYLAKDKSGRLVKGTAPIETEGELLNATTHEAILENAKISWTGYGEIGGYSLTGSIDLKKANIVLDSSKLKSAAMTIDMKSIVYSDEHLQEHLRGEDFFDVAKYPTAIFESESIKYSDATHATLKGKLTIKGITKSIQFPVTIQETNKGRTVNGKMVIDRTAFGIRYNSKSFFGDLGDQAIKNNFDLVFELRLK